MCSSVVCLSESWYCTAARSFCCSIFVEITTSLQTGRCYGWVQEGYKCLRTFGLAVCDTIEGFHILTHIIQLHKHCLCYFENNMGSKGPSGSLTCTDWLPRSVVPLYIGNWSSQLHPILLATASTTDLQVSSLKTDDFWGLFIDAKVWHTSQAYLSAKNFKKLCVINIIQLVNKLSGVNVPHSKKINYNTHLWVGDVGRAGYIEGTFSLPLPFMP